MIDVFPHLGKSWSFVLVVGQGLSNASEVDFGTQPAIFLQLDSSLILALAPPEPTGTKVDVTVTTPLGTSATTPADGFTFAPGSGDVFGFPILGF